MEKKILITGSTDGIGLETAKALVSMGHQVFLHGRNVGKLKAAEEALSVLGPGGVETYLADLSSMAEVEGLARAVAEKHSSLDVLINNAGVFNARDPKTKDGLDVRFVVNTIAPYLLTRRLLPLLGTSGRVVNLSSAAQAPVNLEALGGKIDLSDRAAYAQSKLALTMWSTALSATDPGPMIVSVNPGSLLATKMVKQAFGIAGGDVGKGADILCRAALSEEFADASGRYFDNDSGRFAAPHPDGLDAKKNQAVLEAVAAISDRLVGEFKS